ncbi:MAG: FAD:protein FMN transferase [Oscillospiraceae bacterium]|nr:FAD:protein FMN transferase [Oscillospiraceae bacterium]
MKKTRIFALAAVLLLTACTPDAPYQANISFFSMDTYMEITAYGHVGTSLDDCKDEINRLEALLSVTSPDSDIGRLNASGMTDVSPETAEIIKYAQRIGGETNGALDITVYPVLKEWGFTTGDYKIPDGDTLNALLQKVDFTQIKADDSAIPAVTVPDGVQLDLGALAKGYASDKAAEILRENGITSALINLGGSIMTIGGNPSSGSPWRIGIRNPFSLDENIGVIEVADKAVVTSGSYERCFTADGKTYHHIIDPATGCPAESGLVSVTVIGGSGIMCDALSTAFFVMGAEKAAEFHREKGGFDMILVTVEGEILITEGIADTFTNLSKLPLTVL